MIIRKFVLIQKKKILYIVRQDFLFIASFLLPPCTALSSSRKASGLCCLPFPSRFIPFSLSLPTHKHKHKNAADWAEEPYQGHTLIFGPHDPPRTLRAACVPLWPIIMHWAEPLSHDPPLISRIPELKQACIQSTAGTQRFMTFYTRTCGFLVAWNWKQERKWHEFFLKVIWKRRIHWNHFVWQTDQFRGVNSYIVTSHYLLINNHSREILTRLLSHLFELNRVTELNWTNSVKFVNESFKPV